MPVKFKGTSAAAPKSKTNAKLLARMAKIKLARNDFIHFVEYVIKDKDGNSIKIASHQRMWWEHIKYAWMIGKYAIIISPMSYGKTVWIANALPLWLLGLNNNLRILIVSATDKLARERLEEIGRYIRFSPQYREVFPNVQVDDERNWNQHDINVKRTAVGGEGGYASSITSSVSAYGYTADAGNGVRADVILPDDVVSEGNSDSIAGREQVDRMMSSQWLTRTSGEPVKTSDGRVLSDDSIITAIGTRYNSQDFYATKFLASPQAYCTMVQAVSEDKTHLTYKVRGALEYPSHPVWEELKDWEPQ